MNKKDKRGKTNLTKFDFSACVKLTKSLTDDKQLDIVFGHENPFNKTVFFHSSPDRGFFYLI